VAEAGETPSGAPGLLVAQLLGRVVDDAVEAVREELEGPTAAA